MAFIYLFVAVVLCSLVPSILVALGWIVEQNEKINQGQTK